MVVEGAILYAKTGSARLLYTEHGDGLPVILVHGGGPGANGIGNFSRNISALARHFRVIVPDLAGFGGSDSVPVEGGLFSFHANMLRGLMDALDIPCADLIGNSLGAGAAMKLALDTPDRVRSLVLMGGGSLPVLTPTPSQGMAALASYYVDGGPTLAKMRGFLATLVHDSRSLDNATVEARFAASVRAEVVATTPLRAGAPILEPLWRMGVEALTHKTLLIWGRDDRVVPLDGAFLLLALMQRAELHVFSGCGHWSQWEKPDAFNRLVIGFLENHQP